MDVDGVDLDRHRRIAAVAALDQPVRRELHRLLAREGWITRDDAAAALDVARSVAAFHLDKLADAGVVEVRFERTSGRRGPGAGRPSKLYRLRASEVSASVPDRHYDLAGSILAAAMAASVRTGSPAADCLRDVARETGREHGEAARRSRDERDAQRADLLEALAADGYEPAVSGDEIVLRNCPFHRLADEQRDLVCGMNLDFVGGLLDGVAAANGFRARLEPTEGTCCVRLAPMA